MFTNGTVAVNRALSCHPLLPISVALRTKKATCVIIGVIWVTSCIIYMCPAFIERVSWAHNFLCTTEEIILEEILKGEDPRQRDPAREVLSFTLATTLIATFLANAIAYAVIIVYLKKNSGSDQRQQDKKRALLIIVMLFCVLLICWVPVTCVLIIDPSLVGTNHNYIALPAMEAAIDPILCMITMPVFRPEWMTRKKTGPATVSSMPTAVSGTVLTTEPATLTTIVPATSAMDPHEMGTPDTENRVQCHVHGSE